MMHHSSTPGNVAVFCHFGTRCKFINTPRCRHKHLNDDEIALLGAGGRCVRSNCREHPGDGKVISYGNARKRDRPHTSSLPSSSPPPVAEFLSPPPVDDVEPSASLYIIPQLLHVGAVAELQNVANASGTPPPDTAPSPRSTSPPSAASSRPPTPPQGRRTPSPPVPSSRTAPPLSRAQRVAVTHSRAAEVAAASGISPLPPSIHPAVTSLSSAFAHTGAQFAWVLAEGKAAVSLAVMRVLPLLDRLPPLRGAAMVGGGGHAAGGRGGRGQSAGSSASSEQLMEQVFVCCPSPATIASAATHSIAAAARKRAAQSGFSVVGGKFTAAVSASDLAVARNWAAQQACALGKAASNTPPPAPPHVLQGVRGGGTGQCIAPSEVRVGVCSTTSTYAPLTCAVVVLVSVPPSALHAAHAAAAASPPPRRRTAALQALKGAACSGRVVVLSAPSPEEPGSALAVAHAALNEAEAASVNGVDVMESALSRNAVFQDYRTVAETVGPYPIPTWTERADGVVVASVRTFHGVFGGGSVIGPGSGAFQGGADDGGGVSGTAAKRPAFLRATNRSQHPCPTDILALTQLINTYSHDDVFKSITRTLADGSFGASPLHPDVIVSAPGVHARRVLGTGPGGGSENPIDLDPDAATSKTPPRGAIFMPPPGLVGVFASLRALRAVPPPPDCPKGWPVVVIRQPPPPTASSATALASYLYGVVLPSLTAGCRTSRAAVLVESRPAYPVAVPAPVQPAVPLPATSHNPHGHSAAAAAAAAAKRDAANSPPALRISFRPPTLPSAFRDLLVVPEANPRPPPEGRPVVGTVYIAPRVGRLAGVTSCAIALYPRPAAPPMYAVAMSMPVDVLASGGLTSSSRDRAGVKEIDAVAVSVGGMAAVLSGAFATVLGLPGVVEESDVVNIDTLTKTSGGGKGGAEGVTEVPGRDPPLPSLPGGGGRGARGGRGSAAATASPASPVGVEAVQCSARSPCTEPLRHIQGKADDAAGGAVTRQVCGKGHMFDTVRPPGRLMKVATMGGA